LGEIDGGCLECLLRRRLIDNLNAMNPSIKPNHKAIDEFKERVPDLALGLVEKIRAAHADKSKCRSCL